MRLNSIKRFFTLNCRRLRKEPVLEFEDECIEEEEQDVSTQFFQTQKNQRTDLQDHFERYCNVLPVFGFDRAKYDINKKKSCLLLLLVIERKLEPVVIKKANQFVSFKFGDLQLLNILHFLGGALSLGSFLKAYKTSATKESFLYEWFNDPEKLNGQLLPHETFPSKLRNNKPIEKCFSDFQSLIDGA